MTAPSPGTAPAVLAALTSPEVPAGATVLVPVGSLEQHGPHLPLETDTVVASGVAARAAALLGDPAVVLAPPVAYGSSGEHQSFAGTTSVGTEVLHALLVELVRSLRTWARRVVLVNGHGGNLSAVTAAVEQLRHEGHDVAWVPCAVPGADAHAGRTETSLMLHLLPASVRMTRAEVGSTTPVHELMPTLRAGGVAAVSANGVLGDPTGAGAEEGASLLEQMARLVVEVVGDREPAGAPS